MDTKDIRLIKMAEMLEELRVFLNDTETSLAECVKKVHETAQDIDRLILQKDGEENNPESYNCLQVKLEGE